jgi:hypothetical protein
VLIEQGPGRTRKRWRVGCVIGAALVALVCIGGGQALASSGCTAVASGAWNGSFDEPPQTFSDTFAVGDSLSFTIGALLSQGKYTFGGALAAGGSGIVGAHSSTTVNITVTTAGTGSLTVDNGGGRRNNSYRYLHGGACASHG